MAGMIMLWIPSPAVLRTLGSRMTSPSRNGIRGDNVAGYFTKRSMSETEPAMRFLKFQMRAKVLP